jgi:hypothetical protein
MDESRVEANPLQGPVSFFLALVEKQLRTTDFSGPIHLRVERIVIGLRSRSIAIPVSRTLSCGRKISRGWARDSLMVPLLTSMVEI